MAALSNVRFGKTDEDVRTVRKALIAPGHNIPDGATGTSVRLHGVQGGDFGERGAAERGMGLRPTVVIGGHRRPGRGLFPPVRAICGRCQMAPDITLLSRIDHLVVLTGQGNRSPSGQPSKA